MRTKGVGFCLAVTACWVSGLVLDSPCFGRHDPRFPDHPVTATVRTADMPFKRLPPEMSPPPAVNLPTADLSWDSQTFQSPWSILDKADPSLFREQLNQLRENGQPAADFEHSLSAALSASPLTAEQLRSLGWAVSFVANSHHGGLAWYRQCVAKIRENSNGSLASLNPSDRKLLDDLRNKLQDAGAVKITHDVSLFHAATRRLSPEAAPPSPVDIPTADLSWDARTFESPWTLLNDGDPRLKSSFVQQITAWAQGKPPSADDEKDLMDALHFSSLTATQLCDLGWSLSFVAGSHRGGEVWYHQAIAVVRSHITIAPPNEADRKLVRDLRNKLYDAQDWDGLQQLCETALAYAPKGSNDEFWWTLFYSFSFSRQQGEGNLMRATSMLEQLNAQYRHVHLGHYERESLDWNLGNLLFVSGRYAEAVPYLFNATDDHSYDHAQDAFKFYVLATIYSSNANSALSAFTAYCDRYHPPTSEIIEFQLLIEAKRSPQE